MHIHCIKVCGNIDCAFISAQLKKLVKTKITRRTGFETGLFSTVKMAQGKHRIKLFLESLFNL
jgi:hypothetical protein